MNSENYKSYSEVKDLQRFLKSNLFDPGPIDGSYGIWTQKVELLYKQSKSKDKVTVYKYHHSMFLDSDKPEKSIIKKSGKYDLSLRRLRISGDGGSYTLDRETLVMRDYVNGYNCEIFETFIDQESLMKARINLFIKEIKNKNKF